MKSVVVFACIAFSGLAQAEGSGDARMHFERGSAHYAVGEFAEAAEEYLAAYKIKQDPALLYNTAQAYRLAGNHEKALILYRNYVLFYPKAENIDEVKSQINKLKEAIASSEKAKTSPPVGTVEPTPPLPSAEPSPAKTPNPAPTPAPAIATPPVPAISTANTKLEVAAPAPRKTPLYKKWWLWTIVGVVAAGAVIGGTVAATSSAPSWSSVPDIGPGAHR